ncbi:MAG: hypothetical protein SGJ20_01730 [Planctomycetota bacterium]|nr:hypothetical protein [Planctomycetota bacterium]
MAIAKVSNARKSQAPVCFSDHTNAVRQRIAAQGLEELDGSMALLAELKIDIRQSPSLTGKSDREKES